MATVRDNQRSRHYAAENFLYEKKSQYATKYKWLNLNRGSSIQDCQSYVDLVADEFWFRRRFGKRQIWVRPGRNGGKAFSSGRITLGTWARNEAVVLHEMAHCLAPSNVKHGPEFAGIFLFLVQNVFGKEVADELRVSYKANKVRYNNKAIPAINKSVKTTRQMNVIARKKFVIEKREKAQKMKTPLSFSERKQLEQLLKQAVASGVLGEAGDKKRRQALAIAKAVS